MSQSAPRRSSPGINSRRGPQKAHIPFRGDDLEHGKKTGKKINKVSRDSDDFEPFEEVLDQAYNGDNPPRASTNKTAKLVNGKSRRGSTIIPEDGDDHGELSMDIDSSQNSPAAYFRAVTAPLPSSTTRVGSSSRALPRGSDVDYDRVPSPRAASRRSFAQPLNPSRLRHEVHDYNNTRHSAIAYDDYNGGAMDDGQDDFNFPEGDNAGSPRGNISFTELAQNDEEVDSPGADSVSPIPTRTDKGKQRAAIQEDSDGKEDAEIEDELYDDGESEASGPNKSPRKDKNGSAVDVGKKPPKKKPQRTKEQQPPSISETTNQQGLRRSQRRHYPPLEYWRQEKVVWGRRQKGPDKGPCYVPVIKEIITIPKPPPQPLGGKKRKRARTHGPRSKSKSLAPETQTEEIRVIEVDNPELGWDDETPSHGVIIDLESSSEVQRRVAFTAKMVKPMPAGNSNYLFQKIFGDGDFIAGGQLVIPPGEEKPAKPTKDNTYIFYVIEGAVQFRVHRSTFILATGGMFLVPRGNQYYIKNICERDAKLFFAQARKIVEGENQAPTDQARLSAPPRARSTPRSSSHGAPSPKRRSRV